MSKNFIHIVVLLLVSFACGTKKDLVENSSQISKKDYPYITKFHEGIRLQVTGRTEEAIAKFEECLAIRQNDDAVYYALSKLELKNGNLDQSATYIVKASEIDPSNTWYTQELAYMYFENGNFEKSAESFSKLVAIEPRNVDWQYGYAEALVKTGESEKAIEALNKTEDQVGVNPALSIQKYNLFMTLKKEREALDELNKARVVFPLEPQLIATLVDHYFKNNDQEKAVSMLKELVVADPSNGRAHLALADVYLQQRKESLAYEELNAAFDSPDLDLDTKMKILINIHESSYVLNPIAFELVKKVVEAHPTEAKAYSIQGDYLMRKEEDKAALASYKKALELDNSQYPIWNQVLIMEYQSADYESLYQDSKECLSLFPAVSTVYLLNGVSANQLKKYNEAIDVLTAGVELVVNDKPLKAEFYGQIGEGYFGVRDYKMGKEKYTEAMKIDATSVLIKNNFAFRLATAKYDLELAERLAQEVLENSSSHAQFIDTYGWVLFQKGQYEDALYQFMKANDVNDKDRLLIEHIGDANFKLGNIEEAIKWWKKAVELGSKSELLEQKIANKKYYDAQ